MAKCRIYLFTYKRNHLLPRAVHSVINQTLSDWICEIHNDDPDDKFPAELVEKLADPRIKIINHEKRLGGTRAFNLVFQPAIEQYVTLLEDDNWWNPQFLEVMVSELDRHQDITIAWANQRCWVEEQGGGMERFWG